jgi:tRNA threonylcarbamoyladenosine biosynthesis protein TsaE
MSRCTDPGVCADPGVPSAAKPGREPDTSVVETASAAQTEALGGVLGARLGAGDVVLLCGELGSGKTTLARGIARALGVSAPVTSPTFTIAHRYQGSERVVSHIDLYRVRELANEEPGLLEDYLAADEVALVEWPQDAMGELPSAALAVTLAHRGGDRRRVEVEDRR